MTKEKAKKIAKALWGNTGYAVSNDSIFNKACAVGFMYGPMCNIMGRGVSFEAAFKNINKS